MGNGLVCTVSVFGGKSLFVSGDITLGHDLTSLILQLKFLYGPDPMQELFLTLREPLSTSSPLLISNITYKQFFTN